MREISNISSRNENFLGKISLTVSDIKQANIIFKEAHTQKTTYQFVMRDKRDFGIK